jgi:signal transduction histidine kinase
LPSDPGVPASRLARGSRGFEVQGAGALRPGCPPLPGVPFPMRARLSLRGRLFVALFLTAAIPSAILLGGGALLLREIVVGTGSAGPWDEVAGSGSRLLEAVLAGESASSRALVEEATRHRDLLSESVRLSRLYAFLGDRVLGRLPWVAGGGFLLLVGLSLWSAKQLSRALSRPVRDIVQWTERLGSGVPLPPRDPASEDREIREFRALRGALRAMESSLGAAREREIAEARNRSWSEMARRIAHDLKNPLTPMQMAARTAAASTDPRAAMAGQVLLEEIARLDELSRAFAQFGRPPEGPPSPVDVDELLSGLLGRMDPGGTLTRLERRGATGAQDSPTPRAEPNPTPPPFVLGHPVALERVLRNLLANALDASAETLGRAGAAEPVRVTLDSGAHQLQVRIVDQGPGLPPGEEDRIWEPDFTTKRRGTGLGLPLVRQVVEAHGGAVHAFTRPEGGAEFQITLPIAPGTTHP